ncbi:helix-turn-helix domain-containing protein [Frateuria edaphi]|uniref:transcriptional regulator n=1 Tax=Frateuria edaphi TaxID=2898793 RepID=UPI001E5A3F49|nr:helix-turn-helix domain-containing protein [Frateuria edaphi]UGB46968.1 helix-turn-helix domain-containing protein [Frateuria edaphi]
MDKPTAIQKAVEACDNAQAELARRINVAPQLVWQWCDGRRPVPAHRCLAIEQATNGVVTRFDLRPDVFGSLQPTSAGQGEAHSDAA